MNFTTPSAEFRDPIHGYIYASEVERTVIDTGVFQRLRRIRQLAGAHLTYPGAQHSRFEHSVGAMHLAGLSGLSLMSKTAMTEDDIQQMRLAALLHDVGHGAFSHLFEEVMSEKRGITHEQMTERVLKETELKDVLSSAGYGSNDIIELALGRPSRKPQFMSETVGGGLSVDIMDYLLRDSYFTGVEYGRIDVHRIINSYEVMNDKLALDSAALYAFEAFIISRYEMFKAVYFHRTVRAAEIMLVRAMGLADDFLHITDTSDLSHYLSLTDEVVLFQLLSLDPRKNRQLEEAKKLAVGYANRKLWKCVFEKTVHRKDRLIERIFSQKGIRDQIASQIADEAGVDANQILIDVPTTPSVPFTSARESLETLALMTKGAEGRRYQTISVNELPLVSAITGFVDILRVYTPAEFRERVEAAAESFFGKEGFMTKISV